MSYVRSLGFEETPDYEYLRDLFSQALKSTGEVEDGEYDWMKLNGGKGWDATSNKKRICMDMVIHILLDKINWSQPHVSAARINNNRPPPPNPALFDMHQRIEEVELELQSLNNLNNNLEGQSKQQQYPSQVYGNRSPRVLNNYNSNKSSSISINN